MSVHEQLQTFEDALNELEPCNNHEEKGIPKQIPPKAIPVPNSTPQIPATRSQTHHPPPPEIHLLIFDRLTPVQSTCFGLTNKQFYALHRAKHGTIPSIPGTRVYIGISLKSMFR